eukprot:6583844-Prymnesium_polylepis.1
MPHPSQNTTPRTTENTWNPLGAGDRDSIMTLGDHNRLTGGSIMAHHVDNRRPTMASGMSRDSNPFFDM